MKYIVKTAFRNLRKSKVATFFNFVGLITAFTAFILIMIYVWSEYHFDRYHAEAEHIYRLELKSPEKEKTSVYMSGQTKDVIMEAVPEVVATTTYMPWGKWGEGLFIWNTRHNEVKSYEDYAIADKNLTEVFTFDFVRVTDKMPLAKPNTVIVSDEFAHKAWGAVDVIGETVKYDEVEYAVSGVFKKPCENSVFDAPLIFSMPATGWIAESYNEWGIVNFPEFIRVKGNVSKTALQSKVNNISVLKEKYSYMDKGKDKFSIILRPLTELRFAKDVAENPLFNTNSKTSVNILFVVGIFILLIALLNYINFSTAILPKKLKNIGISRIVGSDRRQVLMTHIAEGVWVFVFSCIIALVLAFVINKNFAVRIFEYKIDLHVWYGMLGFFVLLSVALGILSSFVPAFGSLSVSPADSIKKKNRLKSSTSRGALTIVQFATTIILVSLSILVVKQISYMKNAPLGFAKDNTLVLPMNKDLAKNSEVFMANLKANPMVKGIALSAGVPGRPGGMEGFLYNNRNVQTWLWNVDENYIPLMNFKIVKGRDFIKNSTADRMNLIINQTAAKTFGWKVGTQLSKYNRKNELMQTTIIGIIEDFHFASRREKIEPFAFRYNPEAYMATMNIKLNTSDTKAAIAFISKTYDKLGAYAPLRYYFLNDKLDVLYAKEDRQAGMITLFSILSLIISVLGILGLVIFTAQYRIKEIGVRKVNGATVWEIMAILNQNTVKWVAIAFALSVPIAYYAMHKWLQTFAYKTPLSWWIFALAGLVALTIALLTVSWQSWRAATRNPVEALRYE